MWPLEGGLSRARNWALVTAVLFAVPVLPSAQGVLGTAAQVQSTPSPDPSKYLGKAVCGECHEDRYQQHAGSNFDLSWQPASKLFESDFPQQYEEAGILYRVEKSDRWVYRIRIPGRVEQVFPVHSIIGGKRHGTSFILDVRELEGRPLPRPTLVEARYMVDAKTGRLKLSPGFPLQPPRNYETAIGRVLSPEFGERCLNCHGGMTDAEIARAGGPHPLFLDTGIACERCHGPGADHLEKLDAGGADLGIVNPAKRDHAGALSVCAECHSGIFPVLRPRPDDLLISNQATALASTRCYKESGQGFSCISCHDPHGNAPKEDPRYEGTCKSCHSSQGRSRCPVDSEKGCIGCHMPNVVRQDSFPLTDHWIRVVR